MLQWEYQVIRLNIEPPVEQGVGTGESQSTAENKKNNEGVFSEAYLKEEFPRFYDSNEQAKQQAQQADPAFQLQDFLNSQGQQGWELVGFQHAMPHVFIVFKRLKEGHDSTASSTAQAEQLRLSLDLANRALAIIEKRGE